MRTADCTTGKIGLEVGVLYTRESAFKPIVRSADPQICSPHLNPLYDLHIPKFAVRILPVAHQGCNFFSEKSEKPE